MQLLVKLAIVASLFGIDYLYRVYVVTLNDFPRQYFYAGLCSMFVIFFLRLFGKSKLTVNLQILYVVWIVGHAYGFVIYMLYFPPFSYDYLQVILNVAQIVVFIAYDHDTRNRFHDPNRSNHFRNDDRDLSRIYYTGENR